MTDDDRLADYFARLETPEHRRTLVDGCSGCQHSATFCRAVTWHTDEPCCDRCTH